MLVLGTCNPRGEGATYNGLYLRQAELEDVVATRAMVDVPVKTEHSGANVGRVVSAFLDGGGALQCVMEVDEASVVRHPPLGAVGIPGCGDCLLALTF